MSKMTDVAIGLYRVSKQYRNWRGARKNALSPLDLEIQKGEAFGFIGQNGAGKSTTIKIIMGLLKPTEGKAELFGKPASDHSARLSVGYVPENPLLYELLTPYEILTGVLALRRPMLGRLERHAHVMSTLETLSLEAVARRPLRGFSKGMVQRVGLAQAFIASPDILVLDEPLSGLDPVGRKEVVDLLLNFKQRGGTIFFSSHVLHDVERIADRFGLIHQGELKTVQDRRALMSGNKRLIVRSAGVAQVPDMERLADGEWMVEVSQEQLWDKLDSLRSAGHCILEVRPQLSLEKIFLEFLGAHKI